MEMSNLMGMKLSAYPAFWKVFHDSAVKPALNPSNDDEATVAIPADTDRREKFRIPANVTVRRLFDATVTQAVPLLVKKILIYLP